MPAFTMKLNIPQDFLDKLRALPERIQINTRRAFVRDLGPAVQADVDAIMPDLVPAGVSSPFVFGNDPEAATRSRKAYFAIIRADPTLTDGSHWIRRPEIEKGFRVFVSDRLRGGLVTITNVHPDAKWVYPGIFQVFGHRNSGWGDEFDVAKQLLREAMVKRAREIAVYAANEAVRGRDVS